MHGVDQQKATRRLVGMLARKGYGAGLAFAIVRDELRLHDEGELDVDLDAVCGEEL
jgi:regulatory protein